MIGRDQFMRTVIVLPALETGVAITRSLRQLLRPVHPADPGIPVVGIDGADLHNVCNPGSVSRPGLHCVVVVHVVLPRNADLVCDVNKALVGVLHPIL